MSFTPYYIYIVDEGRVDKLTRRFAFIVDKEITFFNKIITAMQISLSTRLLVNSSTTQLTLYSYFTSASSLLAFSIFWPNVAL